MRLFASRIRSGGETCEHADTRAALQNVSAGVDMFASHRYFNQLSKNNSASKELFSLYLTCFATFIWFCCKPLALESKSWLSEPFVLRYRVDVDGVEKIFVFNPIQIII
jgi:hypothetical protein